MRLLVTLVAAAALCLPAASVAEPGAVVDETTDGDEPTDAEASPEADPRDEAIFGETVDAERSEEASREEAIFGESDEASSRDEAFFGEEEPTETEAALGLSPGPSDREIGAMLEEANDPLTLGGRLYLRLDWTALEEGYPEDFPWRTPALLDLYLDARPNDRVRAFVKGRVSHDFTMKAGQTDFTGQPVVPTRVMLDQLWVKWDLDRVLFVTVGQQPLRWGSGRFWNPTDFLNRSFKDPLAVFDERLGVTLLKLHLPIESLGWNLYAIADLEGARIPEEVSGAFRAEALFGTTELALSAAVGKDEPLRLGADLTTGIGPVDFRLETALLHGVRTPTFEGSLDLATFTLPTEVDRRDDWILRLTTGAELGINLSDEDALYLGIEYFYNGLGYDDAEIYSWLLLSPSLHQVNDELGLGLDLPAAGSFTPFYLGRHYASFYASLPAPGRWDEASFTLSALSNLSDRSAVVRLDFSLQVVTYLRFNAYVASRLGKQGEFRLGLDLPPVPVQGLEEGFRVVPPLLDVGLGLTLTL